MMVSRAACALGVLVGLAVPGAMAQPARPPAAQDAPWPDASVLAERRTVAEGRRLFATDAPLDFTLTADFKAVNRDRNPESTRLFPATLTVAGADGAPVSVPVQIRTRGHARRMLQTCSFAPIRLEFAPEAARGTIFEGHKNLKLGTHCRDADLYEQYVPREYTAYRIFNLLTPRSFRARLANATYVDTATRKTVGSRQALFIEDDDDVARRLGGRTIDTMKITFRRVDPETITLLSIFEYMIGNTDMSMYALHNIVLVQTPAGAIYPVPYDFDYAGLVDARYAIPAKQFGLATVRDRLYLGPCRSPEELEPFFQRFRAVKSEVLALFDTIPGHVPGYKKDAIRYIEQFYQTISRPGDIKRAFVDGCGNRAGM